MLRPCCVSVMQTFAELLVNLTAAAVALCAFCPKYQSAMLMLIQMHLSSRI